MAKKIAKTKTKKVKTIVAEIDAKAIIPDNPEEIISALKALKETSIGWQVVVKVITENIKALEEQIIKKVDLDGNPLTDQEVDHLRDLRDINEEVMKTPDNYIKQLTAEPEEEKDGDPYQRAGEKK